MFSAGEEEWEHLLLDLQDMNLGVGVEVATFGVVFWPGQEEGALEELDTIMEDLKRRQEGWGSMSKPGRIQYRWSWSPLCSSGKSMRRGSAGRGKGEPSSGGRLAIGLR